MKRLLTFLCIAGICCLPLSFPVQAQGTVFFAEEDGEPVEDLINAEESAWETLAPVSASAMKTHAKGAVLLDQTTGQVLYAENEKAQLPIASVTKVMTLLLIAEAIDNGTLSMTDTVTCSEQSASLGGSQIWLEPGEIMTVEELIKAAAVVSANDACSALAEHLCGSGDVFVERMNNRAKELGMDNTLFKDCSGLDDTGYSCALDVAIMSRELMKHSLIVPFTTTWMDSLRGGKSQLVNTNKMIRFYNGATGLKTGTTQAAGHCLAATATRDNTSFVAVVLGCDTTQNRFSDARMLLDYGFAHYVSVNTTALLPALSSLPVLKGQEEQVAVSLSVPEAILMEKGQENSLTSTMDIAENVEAPVEEGQKVGTWRLMAGETVIGEYPICTVAGVKAKTFRWAYSLLLSVFWQ